MAAVPITLVGILAHDDGTSENVTFTGLASLTGLGVGGGPIQPPTGAPPHPSHPIYPGEQPEHPIVIPPPGSGGAHPSHPIYYPGAHPEHPIVIPPPPTEPPADGGVKPPPEGGGWGYHPEYGWGYFPGQGGKPQPPGR